MPHGLIIGQTETGKTMFAKEIATGSRKAGRLVAVFDPMRSGWDCDYATTDPEQFKYFLRTRKDVTFFADECALSMSRYDTRWDWMVTTSRHMGHNGYLIGQGMTQFNPTVRKNARTLYLFAGCPAEEIRMASREFNHAEIESLPALQVQERRGGEFLKIHKFKPIEKYRLDFRTRKVTLINAAPHKVSKP